MASWLEWVLEREETACPRFRHDGSKAYQSLVEVLSLLFAGFSPLVFAAAEAKVEGNGVGILIQGRDRSSSTTGRIVAGR